MPTFSPYITKRYQLDVIDKNTNVVTNINPPILYVQDGYTGVAIKVSYPHQFIHANIEKIQIKSNITNVNNAEIFFWVLGSSKIDLNIGDKIATGFQQMSNRFTAIFGGSGINPSYYSLFSIIPAGSPFLTYTDPSITITYSSIAIPVINQSIQNSYVNIEKDLVISYSAKNNPNILEQFSIKSGVFHYAEITDSGIGDWVNVPFIDSNFTLQANTLVRQKKYKAYATITVDDNQTADTVQVELTTVDTIPVLTPVSPVNEYSYGDVKFVWDYSNATGTEQYAYDLQYSAYKQTWIDLDNHKIATETNATHTIPAGEFFWRVKGYNQGDVPSEWSSVVKFINIAKPSLPVITEIVESGRPTIKWSAENQIAFEIEINGIRTSGEVYSTNKFYTFQEFIPNGNYKMKLRIINQYAQKSDWLEFDYSQNMNVVVPNVSISETEKGFNISITRDSSIDKYYLLRNGIPIHKFTELSYEDIYVNGYVAYAVRGVDFNGNFNDYIEIVTRKRKEVTLIDLKGNFYDLGSNIRDWTKIEKSTIMERKDVSYMGRSKPVIINGDIKYSQWNIGAIFSDIPLGEIMFYRDYTGASAWVMSHNIGSTINKNYTLSSTTLREVSYDERIEY